MWRYLFLLPVLLISFLPVRADSPETKPPPKYAAVAAELERFITQEMKDKKLPAVSIALVEDQTIVWAKGFGMAKPKEGVPATAETVYRVGSVSKLFTDIGIMQLVEKGQLDLDAPVTKYLPDFQPQNPTDKPITLRQLMSHRAGLVREPPAGNYFDPTPISLADTVKSLNRTKLVYPPEQRTKYSNAGIAVVGRVLEVSQKQPFEKYLQKAVLEPMSMRRSSFTATPEVKKDLATAFMWTYHGRQFEAPTFPLGMAPAGSMYSTVNDLGKFLSVLFAGGKGVLKRETLEQMWTPQFAPKGTKEGFGIGFAVRELYGPSREKYNHPGSHVNPGIYRCVRHGGAIYGFATELAALPEEKLGVVMVTSMDCCNPVVECITDLALRSMLFVKRDEQLPAWPAMALGTKTIDPDHAQGLQGVYEDKKGRFILQEREGKLYAFNLHKNSFWVEMKIEENEPRSLIANDRLKMGPVIFLKGKELDKQYKRIPVSKPAQPPDRWKGLIGEYGWDHDVLYILEWDGQLYALIEWFYYYPLKEEAENVFSFPSYGLYHDEKLIFTRNGEGYATQVEAASVLFKRRPLLGEKGETFRITPRRPLAELRKEALAATPPPRRGEIEEPNLVDLAPLDPTLKFDIRYATSNNFLSTPFYTTAKAFLQKPAAEALVRVHRSLAKQGYGLLIHDAYRPWHVTRMFWDATPDSGRIFVADPTQGSRHNRGCAVDLTLYDLKTGQPIEMPGVYDEMSDRSYPYYPGGTSLQRWHRDLLRKAMEAEGFKVYEAEWWHFDYKDWKKYPILNLTFEQLAEGKKKK
jgi:CubicO group peptidase (beta-lactamase class C family)/D-alanyl-D-alanine dipeptidase